VNVLRPDWTAEANLLVLVSSSAGHELPHAPPCCTRSYTHGLAYARNMDMLTTSTASVQHNTAKQDSARL
ncbi:hypothetical protein COCCADRAFT_113534, partial [Bipolaris zeicola 26-R-13]